MTSLLPAWLSKLVGTPLKQKVHPKSITLPIPNCNAMSIVFSWQENITENKVEKMFSNHCKYVPLQPFMTKSDYQAWFWKVLKNAGIELDDVNSQVDIVLQRNTETPPKNLIAKLTACITTHEQKEYIKESADKLVMLGQVRQSLMQIKSERLSDEDKVLLSRLLVNFDNEFDRLPQWLIQVDKISKNTWRGEST